MDEIVAARIGSAQHGYLATSRDDQPHIVPIVFVRIDDRIYSPIDGKPKKKLILRRLENIRKNPQVSFLIDQYDDDWNKLWWIRLDCDAEIVKLSSAVADALRRKYPGYLNIDVGQTMISMKIVRASQWDMNAT